MLSLVRIKALQISQRNAFTDECRDYSYYTTVSSNVIFAGCLSNYEGTTVVLERVNTYTAADGNIVTAVPTPGVGGDAYRLSTATISGSYTQWGQALTIEFQNSDLRLFTTSSISATSTTSASIIFTTTAITPTSSGFTAAATATNSGPQNTTTGAQENGLPTSTKVAIGVPVGVVSVLLLVIAVLLYRICSRRRRAKRPQLCSMSMDKASNILMVESCLYRDSIRWGYCNYTHGQFISWMDIGAM